MITLTKVHYDNWIGELAEEFRPPVDSWDRIFLLKKTVVALVFYITMNRQVSNLADLTESIYDILFLSNENDIFPIFELKRNMSYASKNIKMYIVRNMLNAADGTVKYNYPNTIMDSSDYYQLAYYLIGEHFKKQEKE